MILSNVQALLKRKESIKRKWLELFDDESERDTLELSINPIEKLTIESGDINNNEVSTYTKIQVKKGGNVTMYIRAGATFMNVTDRLSMSDVK